MTPAEILERALNGPATNGQQQPVAPASTSYQFKPIAAAEFATGDYRQNYLVNRVLVEGEPAIVAGPMKSLKTNISLDLALSLTSGTPFLGEFTVPAQKRVAIISGESGPRTIQETARRVAAAKDIDLAEQDLLFEFNLPQLGRTEDVAELCRGLKDLGIEVVIIDPLYLTLLSGSGGGIDEKSIFSMGEHLRSIGKLCQQLNVTLILCHHANKQIMVGKAMELQNLAYSGTAEFSRQWILINRQEPYAGDGTHKLILNVGGSAGHGGQYLACITEGVTDERFQGRRWEVAISSMSEAIKEERSAKEAEKRQAEIEKEQVEDQKVMTAVDAICKTHEAATMKEIREHSGMNAAKASTAVQRLLTTGFLEPHEFTKPSGKCEKYPFKGYRRPPGRDGRDGRDKGLF